MKILFDNGTPNTLSRSLAGHEISFARKIGWHELKNGELIQKAEDAATPGSYTEADIPHCRCSPAVTR